MADLATVAGNSTAEYSDCGAHRYMLFREYLRGNRGLVNFIMLNPSTATAEWNDPTVLRCERRALQWGYERMAITNLFSFRATDPKEMMAQGQAATGGAHNDWVIRAAAAEADLVICAWGKGGLHLGRNIVVQAALMAEGVMDKLHALKLAKDGTPCHPLYLPYASAPIPYRLLSPSTPE